MGEVYLAVDQRLGSAVALKRTFFAGDEMLGNAFEREARTLARMRHPVLPKVSDHFGENEEQYLVMEHISGDDLAKRLEAAGKPFPVSWVLFWADQLLDALSYLHTHEPPIIHRDIKPQNLKLTDENHVILLDFGLSKTSTGQTNISQSGSTGSVVGYTPHYAPMEQIRGIGTSPRSDLYSLAATLYQLMTNKVPVDALSRADSMLNELPDPIVPPHELNPEVPKIVSDILLRAMEVSQEKRFSNARDMQRVLRKAFNEMQQATSANTVAFSAEETKAIIGTPPPGATAGTGVSTDNLTGAATSLSAGNSAVDAPAIEPDPAIDLDATMAYGTSIPDISEKQSGVRTEVFIAGENSFAEVGKASSNPFNEPEATLPNNLASQSGVSQPTNHPTQGGVGDVTVPCISIDQDAINDGYSSADGQTTAENAGIYNENSYSGGSSSQPPEPPIYETSVSQPEVAAAASTFGAVPGTGAYNEPVRPNKGSSGKTIAIVGGLAAVLLLGVALAGGIWAYMNYGPGAAAVDPTPAPSPEPTLAATPSPVPTIESVINDDISNSDLGNSNSSNSNSGSLVEPTPDEVTEPDSTTSTRPTPRPNAPRTGSTPPSRQTQPPKKGPVTRPTVMP